MNNKAHLSQSVNRGNQLRFFYGKKDFLGTTFKGIDMRKKVVLVTSEDASSVAFIAGTDMNDDFTIVQIEQPKIVLCRFEGNYVRMRPCQDFDGFVQSRFIEHFDMRGRLLTILTMAAFDPKSENADPECQARWKYLDELKIKYDKTAFGEFYDSLVEWHNRSSFKENQDVNHVCTRVSEAKISCIYLNQYNLNRHACDRMVENAQRMFKNEIASGMGGAPVFRGQFVVVVAPSGHLVFKLGLAEENRKASTSASLERDVGNAVALPKRIRIIDSVIGDFNPEKGYYVLEWIERLGKKYARIIDDSGNDMRISEDRTKSMVLEN